MADGLPAALKDANGHTTAFAYDRFDRLVTTTHPPGSTEAFTYDANSNVLMLKTRAGDTIARPIAYDTAAAAGDSTAARLKVSRQPPFGTLSVVPHGAQKLSSAKLNRPHSQVIECLL